MKLISFSVVVAAVVASSSPTSTFAQGRDAMGDCKKTTAAYMAAYNKGDATALGSMYAKDATYSGAFWTATGRDAIAGGYKAELAGGTKMTQINCAHATYVGQVGYADGPWEAVAKGPDGNDMKVGGHYTVVIRPEGKSYVIVSHTANTQLPPLGAPTH